MPKNPINPEVQSELGKKRGLIGGSRNTPTQWEARSQVGQTYGRSTGLGNQSDELKKTLSSILVFEHKEAPNELFLVQDQQAGIDIARYLNNECEERNLSRCCLDLEKVNRGGIFYSLVKQKRNSVYGWKISSRTSLEMLDD